MLKKFLVKLIFLSFLFNNILVSKDIPIIVIAPSKKPQSLSTVVASVTILDEEFFRNTNEFFLVTFYQTAQLVRIFFKMVVMDQLQQFS